jgi:hypothetical protein
MKSTEKHLQELIEIRNLMEKSSRFLSLSGLSGISAGLTALAGALAGWLFLRRGDIHYDEYYRVIGNAGGAGVLRFFVMDALLVMVIAVSLGFYFSVRRARKMRLPFWNPASRRMLINLFIPIVTGGAVCLILLFGQGVNLIAPLMLIFYGLALINAGKYTQYNINYLGITEIVTGLAGMIFTGYGLLCWILGFGVWHILYGGFFYYRFERGEG